MESFTALADPTRRQIVEMLGAGEMPAGEIARRFEMSAPAVSQHLKA
ncbi:MAG: metalloregulator ArsR/SmtB family transcription factor, partial [Parvibaculum sp.]|nr:metalloregulator ArsR/SmtB family transcription factor [Parvibaculum sp.]